MLVHKKNLTYQGKKQHFKVLFGYFRYVEKNQINLCSARNVLCKKRSLREWKRLFQRAPRAHPSKRNMMPKSFPLKREANVLVLRDKRVLSFWDSNNEDTVEPFWTLLLLKMIKDKESYLRSPNLIFHKNLQQRMKYTIPISFLKVYCSFREVFPNTTVLK